ncbi:ABC transporter permease [Zhihengliuella alba]|uniref:ABC transporter permease n=1 Tax=Zhihengliuella alba TaxID=547018 RepID=A0ABP7CSK3_9MICC
MPAEKETTYVDVAHLNKRGGRQGFVDYLIRVWETRDYISHEAKAQVTQGGEHQFLGNLWLIINPILDGAVYFVVFGLILNLSDGIDNFVAFLLIGVFLFQMTTKCVNGSAMSIYRFKPGGSGGLLPALTAPLSVNARVWLSGFPSYLVLLVMLLLIPPAEELSFYILLLIPIIVLQALVNLGISVMAAHFVAVVPDVNNLLRVSTRAWMYGSGVMFSVDRFAELSPLLAFLIHWNPMAWVLSAARDVTIYGSAPALEGWYIMLLWAVAPLLVGSLLVWWREGTYRKAGDNND